VGYIYDCAEPQPLRHSLAILLVCARGKQYFGIEGGQRYVDISAFHEAVTPSSATHFGGCPDRRARTLSGNLTRMSDVRHGCGWVRSMILSFPRGASGKVLRLRRSSASQQSCMHASWLASCGTQRPDLKLVERLALV
jgi:hypothetical protein